jgi:hypothetical protein
MSTPSTNTPGFITRYRIITVGIAGLIIVAFAAVTIIPALVATFR